MSEREELLDAVKDLHFIKDAHEWDTTGEQARMSVARMIRGFVPKRYWTAQTDISEVLDWFRDPTDTLMLVGPTGSGKTHAVYGGLRRYLRDRYYRRMAGALPGSNIVFRGGGIAEFLDSIKPNADERAFDEAKQAELLFLDDLGSNRMTEWAHERLFAIVDHRYVNGLPMVVCTNVAPTELDQHLDNRVVSRFSDGVTLVAVNAEDRRSR